MQVKRFFAADMRRAMQQVRAELKDDAAIISSRPLAGGVELTASSATTPTAQPAVSPELAAELRKTRAVISEARARLLQTDRGEPGQLLAPDKEPAEKNRQSAPPPPTQTTGVVLAQLREEFACLRELVEVQLGSLAFRKAQTEKPQQTGLWFCLARTGLPAGLIANLLQGVAHIQEPRLAFRHLLAQLTRQIPIQQQDPLEQGGCIALTGPAGAGKTTTLAKLAARHVLKQGREQLALVSMDHFRIGAHEQLKTLAHILDVPVFQARSAEELPGVLERLAHKSLVLIDSSAESQSLRHIECRRYLLLPATSSAAVLGNTLKRYLEQQPLDGLCITHLDEAASLGELIGLAMEQHLPLTWLSDGPRIPDNLKNPRAHQLVAKAFSLQGMPIPDEVQMARLFAELSAHHKRRM